MLSIRIYACHIIDHFLRKLIKSFIIYFQYRTDTHNTENSLQCLHYFFKIKQAFALHKDTSLFFSYIKFTFHFLQCMANLFYQCIFEEITVFSLDTDLSVFDQKCMKHRFLFSFSFPVSQLFRIFTVTSYLLMSAVSAEHHKQFL